jgi:hypothetical protein
MKLDSIGSLFAKAWKLYQKRFSVIIPIFFFPLVLIGIGELLIAHQTAPALLLGALLNLVGVIIAIASSLAMIAAIGKNENFTASYATGFKLFWASIWITILSTLAYFGGFVLLIIPGIMLAIQLAFVQYVLVLENKNGMAALAQSREYMKGYWWAFVGRTLLLGLIYLAAMLIIYLPFKLLLGGVPAAIIYGILLLVLSPFSVAYTYEIFDNLRRLKPDAAAVAAKTEKGFLKVCMVVGIVGFISLIILFFAAAIFLPAAMSGQNANPNGYYPSSTSGAY